MTNRDQLLCCKSYTLFYRLGVTYRYYGFFSLWVLYQIMYVYRFCKVS